MMKKSVKRGILLSILVSFNVCSYSFAYETIGNVIEQPYFVSGGQHDPADNVLTTNFTEDTTIVHIVGKEGFNHESAVGVRWDGQNNMTIAPDKTLKIIGDCYSMAGVVYADDGGEINLNGGTVIIENVWGGAAVHSKGTPLTDPKYASTVINFYNKDTNIIGNTGIGIRLQAGADGDDVAPAVNVYGTLGIVIDRTNTAQQDDRGEVQAIYQEGGKFLADKDSTISVVANQDDETVGGLWQTYAKRGDQTTDVISTPVSTFNGAAAFELTGGKSAYGIYGDSKSEAIFNKGLTVSIQETAGNAFGMYIDESSTVSSENEAIGISIKDTKGTGYGIYGNDKSQLNFKGGIITLQNMNSSAYGIFLDRSSTVDSADEAIGINISESYNGRGIYGNNSSQLNFKGGSVVLQNIDNNAYGISLDNGANVSSEKEAIGISIDKATNAYGIRADNGSTVTSEKEAIDISIKNTSQYAYGLYGYKNGEFKLNGGNITLQNMKKSAAYGIYLYTQSTVDSSNKAIGISINESYNGRGIYGYDQSQLNFKGGSIVLQNIENNAYGISLNKNSTITSEKEAIGISIDKANNAYGIHGDNSSQLNFKGGSVVLKNIGNEANGMYLNNSSVNSNGDMYIDVSSQGKAWGMFLRQNAQSAIDGAYIAAQGSDGNSSVGSYVNWYSNATFNDDVVYNVQGAGDDKEVAALARSGSTIDYKKGLIADSEIVLNAVGNKSGKGSTINVNADKDAKAVVQLKGKIVAGKTDVDSIFSADYDVAVDNANTKNEINVNFLNGNSHFTGVNEFGNAGSEINLAFTDSAYWNMTDSSAVTDLQLGNASLLNMAYDNADNASGFRRLDAINMTSDAFDAIGGTVNMNIDASTNRNNSDRVYIEDVHSGKHYITLNNVDNSGVLDAAGTVLVSVKDEQGEFLAKPKEGKLYWYRYYLDRLDVSEGETVTAGYNTDWILADMQRTDEPTTTVDTILGANALGYYSWILESDKLMKRMGDLRHNGADEEGAWFRVRGSKISRDDNAAFENKYTTYELGYDVLDKETEDYKRYAGAAISYSDGTSSYERGSGENSGKAISFYSTTMRNKGHYLDFVFKVVDMDNDFSVFDTNGNNITGAMDNQGISVNVEYGRKKDLGDKWYIEPQGQLTFGYLGGDNYRLNNGIAVDQGGISSLVGRVGFNIGRDIDEKTNLYLKANLLHEFGGGYETTLTDSSGRVRVSENFDDTWFEYGIGAAFKTGKNNHIYFDIERSTGSDFKKDWQWNAGARWTF